MKTDILITDHEIKITIDDLPHLILKRSELIAIYSWNLSGKFGIDFVFKTYDLEVLYDSKDKWIKILELLNSCPIFINYSEKTIK